ncbi:MAG: HAD hydrolase-like protein [Patescibacteria group bacterium]|jgi:phosphoglycolate phosphatase-like HAD superfamily hydrolase
MKLLLFDIDGTLIKSGADGAHRASFSYATEKVFGVAVNLEEVPTAGKIDSQILIEFLGTKGISSTESKGKLDLLFEHMVQYFKKNSIDLEKFVLPNVVITLQKLQGRKDLILGLLTGNVEEIGWMKMEKSNLRKFFQTGVFGNEALKRTDLVVKALEKVRNYEIQLNDTYIIGDTPLDIKCAQETGCLSVAIPSGSYSAEELAKEKPDYLLKDIAELTDIL